MKQKNLWITVGIPGSGKSYFVRNYFEELVKPEKFTIVSRDEIRFGFLRDHGEADYFDFEDQVWEEYVKQIQNALDDETISDVIADATHLNRGSREKLLSNLSLYNTCVQYIIATTSFNECFYRNNLRIGRARVPETTMFSMADHLHPPAVDEIDKYNTSLIALFDEDEYSLMKREKNNG